MSTKKRVVEAKPKTEARDVNAIPFVMKEEFIQLTVNNEPFTLDKSHPTFTRLKSALERKNWKAVPKLVTLAKALFSATAGNVKVEKGVVMYKGTAIHDSLARRILDLINKGQEVKPMLWFMDNLYKNPEPKAIAEFFDWWEGSSLPMTDDGCFIAYKSVDENLMDQHTHQISNAPGQVIVMTRKASNTNWRTLCSSGFHVCTKAYGLYGTRVMSVKINPADVLAVDNDAAGKLRCLKYEVLAELTKPESGHQFRRDGCPELEGKDIIHVKAERKELIQLLLASKLVLRHIKEGKLKEASIKKASYGALAKKAQQYKVVAQEDTTDGVVEKDTLLVGVRKAHGVTAGQISKHTGHDLKTVTKHEREVDPPPFVREWYLEAVEKLAGVKNLSRSALTFPQRVAQAA